VSALNVSLAALAIMLLSGFGALYLRLPEKHLVGDTKDVVRLGTGLIATIAALVLGLLINSAKSSFDSQTAHIQHIAADVILIDQLLGVYGPEATPAREQLRQAIEPMIARLWQEPNSASLTAFEGPGRDAYLEIALLKPQTDLQRILKDRAIQEIIDLAQARLTLFEQAGNSLHTPFVTVLVLWLAIIFASFGLFSELNLLSVGALVTLAISASSALFLILELSGPFTGLLQISRTPLRNALAPL
jgi:hypothetical protein